MLSRRSLRNAPSKKTSPPISLFQLVTRGHPVRRDDVRAVPAVASECRGPPVRTWHRHLPRDGWGLVKQVRTPVRSRSSAPAPFVHARDPSKALALRRGVRDPQGGVANINREQHYLWRAVDHEGEILKCDVTNRRDKAAALAFLKKALKRHGRAETIVTEEMRIYPAEAQSQSKELFRKSFCNVGSYDTTLTGRSLVQAAWRVQIRPPPNHPIKRREHEQREDRR